MYCILFAGYVTSEAPEMTRAQLKCKQSNQMPDLSMPAFQTKAQAADGQFWEQPIPGGQGFSARTDVASQGYSGMVAHYLAVGKKNWSMVCRQAGMKVTHFLIHGAAWAEKPYGRVNFLLNETQPKHLENF